MIPKLCEAASVTADAASQARHPQPYKRVQMASSLSLPFQNRMQDTIAQRNNDSSAFVSHPWVVSIDYGRPIDN